MKNLLLLTFVSAIISTSAFAHDAKTQPAVSPGKIVNAATIKKAFTNVTFYGSNGLSSTIYITAVNTSTSQSYPLTVTSTFPSVNVDYISIPTGNYNITVSLSESASIYINGGPGKVCDTYYHTFYDVTITDQYASVVDVTYSCN